MRISELQQLQSDIKLAPYVAVSPSALLSSLKKASGNHFWNDAFLAIAVLNNDRSMGLKQGTRLGLLTVATFKKLYFKNRNAKSFYIDAIVAFGNFFSRKNCPAKALEYYTDAAGQERNRERKKWIQLNIAKLYFTSDMTFEALGECLRIGTADSLSIELRHAITCMKSRALLSLGYFAAANHMVRSFRGKEISLKRLLLEQNYLSLLSRCGKNDDWRQTFGKRYGEYCEKVALQFSEPVSEFYEIELTLVKFTFMPQLIRNRERLLLRNSYLSKKLGYRGLRQHIENIAEITGKRAPDENQISRICHSTRSLLRTDNATIIFLTSLSLISILAEKNRTAAASRIFAICYSFALPIRAHRLSEAFGENLWLETLEALNRRYQFLDDRQIEPWLRPDPM